MIFNQRATRLNPTQFILGFIIGAILFGVLLIYPIIGNASQEVNNERVIKRLEELEKVKTQIEQAYTEVISRINELKYLLESKDELGASKESGKDIPEQIK